MEGIRKVEGDSLNDILSLLYAKNILHSQKNVEPKYFLDSYVVIQDRDFEQVKEELGEGEIVKTHTHYYFAFYEIQPGFDFSQLNGFCYFDQGKLVERVTLYRKPEQVPISELFDGESLKRK